MTDLPDNAKLAAGVVFRAFENETVLLNLESGQYHALNATGGRMLELLEEASPDEVARKMAEEYEVPVDQVADDLAELLAALRERGLVTVDGDAG